MRVAFHTSCNEAYLPGLRVLINGIRRTLPDIDILVTSRDLKGVEGCTIIHPAPILGDIPESGRWDRSAWDCMNAAGLVDYDRIVMVGCDQLIVGDVSEYLKNMPKYGALINMGANGGELYKGKFPYFCTGSMIITPGNLKELVAIAKEQEWHLADQTVWNEWAYRNDVEIKQLPEHFDITKRSFVCDKPRWDRLKAKAISVHFVGQHKPWMAGDEKGYKPLNDIWREHALGKYRDLSLT